MKIRFKFILILLFILLCLVFGYLFEDEVLIFSVYDDYFVISYLTISSYIVYLILILFLIHFILIKLRKKRE